MITEFLKITGERENDESVIRRAADVIARGGLVAVPTETVYGLAGSALLDQSAHKIYEAKGRPSDNPLIVHIAYPSDAEKIAYTNEAYYRLAEKFMPGPLTIVLKKKDIIPDSVTGGLDSVAVRCPSNSVAHSLIEVSGHPIAAPSANRSGIPSPTKAEHVLDDMNGLIDMIIDGGECEIGLESTVIRLDGDGCTVLRPGAVTPEMLSEVVHSVVISPAVIEPALAETIKVESPGMKYKHYSPNAEVVLIDATDDAFIDYVNANGGDGCGVFINDENASKCRNVTTMSIGSVKNARDESRKLFALLREADSMGLKKVFVKLPPKEGEYLAIYNRIIRAAGCKILKLGAKQD